MLRIEDMVFQRGETGELIAREVELEGLPDKPKVKIKPITRGKLQEIYATSESSDGNKAKSDIEIIKSGLVEPVLTDEQLADLKPQYANAISIAILAVSVGMSQEEVSNKAQDEVIKQQEIDLKKN